MSKHSNGVKKSKVSKDEVKASSGSIMSFFGRPSKDSNPVSAFSSSNNVEENQQKSISIEKDKDPSSEPISKKRRIIDDVADHDESEKDLDDKMPLEEQDTSEDSMEEMHPQVEGSSEDIFYSESEELPVISKSKTKSSKLKVSNSKKCPSKFLDYDLSLQKWKKGESVPFAALCNIFEILEKDSRRLVKIDALAHFYHAVLILTPNELTSAVQLSVNQVGPAYEGLELGVGDSLLVKAIAETTGTNASKLKTEYDKVGDLATVAESKRLTQKLLFAHANLTVVKVHSTFVKIAKTSGQQNKQNFIKQLMVASKGSEIRYIVRALQGKMRIGCNDATVLSSLAKAISFEKKESEEWANEVALPALKRAHAEVPNWSRLVEGLIQHHQHIERLPDYVYLTPGIPIKAMLAKPTKGIAEIMEKLKDFLLTLEFKYDGERAQFHLLQDGSFRVFSRNAEDNSGKFPDIFPHVRLSLGEHNVTSCILDSEIVAFDTVTQRILPFQTLSTRKRKDVDANDVQVEICVFVFDVLYLNGRSLLRKTLKERRDILHANVVRIPGRVEFAEFRDTRNTEEIEAFLKLAIENNCEGLMVKTLEEQSMYEPDKRSHNWLKLKKDYMDGVTDTLDLVPIGAYYGKGKRTGVYGAYLVACYDVENEEYQSICKIGTGFSDDTLQSLYNALKDHTISSGPSYYRFPATDIPDVFFAPIQVWEVLAADLSISPAHQAAVGIVDPHKGVALRFPRFLKLRDDKGPEDATSSEQVAEMFFNQHSRK